MKFHWNTVNTIDNKLRKFCIELEYKLRPRITHFLMARLEQECCGDFSCFQFDVNLDSMDITIASSTPWKFRRRIASDFEQEINYEYLNQILPTSRAS